MGLTFFFGELYFIENSEKNTKEKVEIFMKFMETRITEIVSPKMYFNNNDYIDDGGVDDPDKDVGFGEEGLEEEPGAGDVPNPDEDDKGSMME